MKKYKNHKHKHKEILERIINGEDWFFISLQLDCHQGLVHYIAKKNGIGKQKQLEEMNKQGMRKCYKCKEVKKIDKFKKDQLKSMGYSYLCLVCSNITLKQRQKILKNKIKEDIKDNINSPRPVDNKTYFISEINKCRNRCQICKIEFNSPTDIKVDHCHKTGEYRGLLCHSCNVGIGHLKESQNIMLNAILYLNKFTKNSVEDFYNISNNLILRYFP